MVASFRFYTSLSEWRLYLQDINFWLNGYLHSDAYGKLEEKLNKYPWWVLWNIGVGPTCCFTRAISSIVRDVRIRRHGPFDHVINVDMKRAAAVPAGSGLSINDKLAIEVAEQLGLLDQEYSRIKAEGDELWHFSYGTDQGATLSSLLDLLRTNIVPQINQKLSTKRYLLVVENVDSPIRPIKLEAFTEDLWFLPPPRWKNSFWHVSTTSQDVYDRSKPDYLCLIDSFSGDDILMLTLYSLHQAAKCILGAIGHNDEQYWHQVAIKCFHYATMLLIPHCSSVHGDGDQRSSADIASNELIRQWAAQGLINVGQERTGNVTYNDIYKVGNVILEAFQEYSLLQLPFSPVTKADETTKSAAHFLACHSLIADGLIKDDELFDGNHPGLKRMQWVTHMADQGCHVNREWLSQESSGPTTLIIRHCSQQSRLFMKVEYDNYFFAQFPCIRVLDLSYTPLDSLPPSLYYLKKLQLLSLKGCYNLASPLSFPDTEVTLPDNNSNNKVNLFYLDLSYSNIETFHSDFFHYMPNLQDLLLIGCSNLKELPPSITTLSTLTKLELTGTQIKSFPSKIFEEMKKLRLLKLIDNKLLGLTEIALDGHCTLSSLSLVGTPLIKRLSLRGCRNLESVDIKDVDALEELDLSATAIKELPDNIPNLPQLRRLLLVGVPSLRRFPWHMLQRIPYEFWLDQCSDGTTVNHITPQVAQVCISDSRLFCSFSDHTNPLVRDGKLLKSFNVRITSCKATTRKTQDEEDMVKTNKHQVSLPTYADVNHSYLTDKVSMMSMDDVPSFRETERHVEISTLDRYPHGLQYLLPVTKSISMSDDTHVSCLNDLSFFLDELEECKLQQCHQMVRVFKHVYAGLQRSLKNAYVSRLKSLTHFYREPGSINANFRALKHLRMEHCPRLEGVMPRTSGLPNLVTLDILFCYNLKAIFHDNGDSFSSSDYQLPCLRRIHLQELPLLEHLHVDDPILTAPAWEELHLRGCWSLRRLPRLRQQPDKAVKVSGERAWWTKLQWDGDDDGTPSSHRGSYEPRLPPASTSIRERVVIKTYLR